MADLAVWQRTIVDEEGNAIPLAEIEVRREEDDTLATLYADRAGAETIENPLLADTSGFVRFFAEAGAYTIEARGAGSTRTWRFDPTGRLKEFDRVSDALAGWGHDEVIETSRMLGAPIDPVMFGAAYDGSPATAALNAAFERAEMLGQPLVGLSPGVLVLDGPVDFRGIDVRGGGTTINANGFDLKNVGRLDGVEILGRPMDRPFRAPPLISPGETKVVYGLTDERFLVATRGPRGGTLIEFNTGNVNAPSLPANSVNEHWELWKTGIVRQLAYGGCFVRTREGTLSGDWLDYTIPISQVGRGDASIVHGDMVLTAKRSQTAGNTISFPVTADYRGMARVAFYRSGTSSPAQEIKIDGSVVGTVDLSGGGGILLADVPCPPGDRTLSIEHPAGANNLYVIGANAYLLHEDFWHVSDLIDHMAVYQVGSNYIGSRGASDYAFLGYADRLWAGSYHGGEQAREPARFALDGELISITPGSIHTGRAFTIFQKTRLDWPAGDWLELQSETIVGDSRVQMFVTGQGDASVRTAYVGMTATQTSYRQVTAPIYVDDVTVDELNRLGPTNVVRQVEASSGRAVTSEVSEFEVINSPQRGGDVISYASGAYAKYYPGWVHNSEQRLTEVRAAYVHTFG